MEADQLSSLHTLKFINNKDGFSCEPRIFYGLTNLKSLLIKNSPIRNIDCTFLADIGPHLNKFQMVSSFREKSINNLTGVVSLPSLESFHLENTPPLGMLSACNFSGLHKVGEMKLINCGIDAISKTTFDPIAETLKILILDSNRLKVLKDTTFDKLLRFGVKNISLAGNQWQCNINRWSIQKKFLGHNISFDPDCEWQCHKLSVGSIVQQFSLHFNAQERKIDAKVDNFSSSDIINVAVVHFGHDVSEQREGYDENHKNLRCSSLSTKNKAKFDIPLATKQKNHVHTACVVDRNKQTVRPLNCYSFTDLPEEVRVPKDRVFISTDYKTTIVCSFIGLCVCAFCLGTAIAYVFFRIQPAILERFNERVVVLKGRTEKQRPTIMIMPKGYKRSASLLQVRFIGF